jgi:DHA1 family tetracycline resistance protein-like MFS transporter
MDMAGVGIVLPNLAPLLLSTNAIFTPEVSESVRNIMLGLLIGIYPFSQFFGSPILGALSDKYGRKPVLVLSLLGTVIGYVLFAVGIILRNLPLLFLSRIVDGLTAGNISVANSAIADMTTPENRAKNFGLIGMAFGLGFIIGPFLGGVLSDPRTVSWFDFSTPYFFAALITLGSLVFLKLFFTETLREKQTIRVSAMTGFHNLKKALQLQNLRTVFIVIFLLTLGFNFFTQFSSVFLLEKFKYTQREIGFFFAYVGFWVAIVQGGVTRLVSKRLKPQEVLKIAPFFLSFFLPLLLVPSKSIGLYAVIPFLALCNGLIYPKSTAIISQLSDEKSQGEILGINQSIQAVSHTIPPVLAGFMTNINLNMPIAMAGILTFMGWLVYMKFYRANLRQKFHEVA